VAPIFAGLAMVADLLVKLLLGPKWAGSAPILAWLAPCGFLLCFYSIISACLLGLGRAQSQFRLTVLSGAVMSLSAFIGAHYGVTGVAMGLSAGAALVGPAYVIELARQLGLRPLRFAAEFAPPLASAAVMMLAVGMVRLQTAHWSDGAQMAAAVAVGVVSFGVTLALLSGRRLLADLRGILPQREPAPVVGTEPSPVSS
jgi:O-antigen/teichoic acid export membrane protein